jgi:hypothetical protein
LIHISLVSPCLVILWQTFFFGFAAKQPSGWFLTWEKERRVRMLVASVQKKVFFWFGGQTKKKLFFTHTWKKKNYSGPWMLEGMSEVSWNVSMSQCSQPAFRPASGLSSAL